MQKFSGGACPQTPLEIVCTENSLAPPLDLILVHCAPPPLGKFLNEGLDMYTSATAYDSDQFDDGQTFS